MNFILASAVLALLVLPSAGHAGWIESTLEPACSDYSRSRVAAGTRRQIEFSVRRAEASIRPPDPVGKLACLDGLMDTRIDQFAPTGNLSGFFLNSLDGIANLPGNVAQRICAIAKSRWNEVTRPLERFELESQDGMPPDYSSRFGLVNFPAQSDSRPAAGMSRHNFGGRGQSLGFGSNNLSKGGEKSDLAGRNSAEGNPFGYGSRKDEIVLPDGERIEGLDAESTLINEIWKSLYRTGK